MIPDAALLETVATGDRRARDAAFELLVERHRGRVWGICNRYFRDPIDAEDAVQEAFVTVLRRAGTFRGEAQVSTWLYRVTVNTCHDIARARGRRPQTPVQDIGAVADAVGGRGGWQTDDGLEAFALGDLLRDALMHLDEETRSLLLLCSVEEVPYTEVAEAYGIAVGTVKSRVFRARAKLAELLGTMLDDDADDGDEGLAPRPGPAPDMRSPTPPPSRGPPA